MSAIDLLRPDIIAMKAYAPGEQTPGALKLNTNECAWPPSPAVRTVLAGVADDSLRLYPDPVSQALREAVGSLVGLSADHVLVGNGSDDCLTILYRSFLTQDDAIASPWPSYGLYDTCAKLQGVPLQEVPWAGGIETDGWRLPTEELLASSAKIIFIANPNNPSATMVPKADLIDLCQRSEALVVVDEAYVDFAGDGATMATEIPNHDNLVVLRTCSKSYAMAGARLGFMMAQPDLIGHLLKVKDSYNINALTQAIGLAAIEDTAYHAELVNKTLTMRADLEAAMTARGWAYPATAGNFVLVEIGDQAQALYLFLKERGLLVRWFNTPQLQSKVRITVGREEDQEKLFAALAEWDG